jgi:hypothetical protein
VKQRPNQTNYNDAGWQIVPGNYERFKLRTTQR